jgi:hypothetical protein
MLIDANDCDGFNSEPPVIGPGVVVVQGAGREGDWGVVLQKRAENNSWMKVPTPVNIEPRPLPTPMNNKLSPLPTTQETVTK